MNQIITEKYKSFYLESLGCFKNTYDSEILIHSLSKKGYIITPNARVASILIINTCSFLTAAVEESFAHIAELIKIKKMQMKKSPLSLPPLLIVVGCLVERFKQQLFEKFPQIDALLGTSDYSQIAILIDQLKESSEQKHYLNFSDIKPRYNWQNVETSPIAINNSHLRFLKISEGCSNGCSFCNIPKLRGLQRSRSVNDIMQELKIFLNWQVKEINLLAQNSSSYGIDLKDPELNLLSLIKEFLTVKNQNYWLRIFYSYPNDYPLELFSLMNESSALIPYVDMPFQHINDSVLKRMNRKITAAEIRYILAQANKVNNNISWRTTFIVGFPGETEADFNELLEFVNEGWFNHIGVFCYSDEDNIVSHKYADDVPLQVKKIRQEKLLAAQNKISQVKNNQLLGKKITLLVDEKLPSTVKNKSTYIARSKAQAYEVDGHTILQSSKDDLSGKFVDAKIIAAKNFDLQAIEV